MSSPAVHISIHTVWRFSPEVAAEFEKELQKLGSKTGTSVSFDQETQCFELIGKSHEELDSVWPQLQSGIRKLTKLKEKKFDGSAAATPTSERQSTANYSPKQVPSSETFANDSNSNGHNNTLADIIGGTSPVARAEIQPSGPASTFESRDFPPSSPSMVPAPLEIDDTVDEMPVSMAFTFSDEVDDLTQVIGSYLGQNIDFLIDICRETYTFFIINGKTINITGKTQEAVNEVIERLKMLQELSLRHEHMTKTVPVIDYPRASSSYKLFFCPLTKYKHADLVGLHPDVKYHRDKLYVMLPAFRNPQTGTYFKPKDMHSEPSKTRQTLSSMQMTPNVQQQQQQQQHQRRQQQPPQQPPQQQQQQQQQQRAIIPDTLPKTASSKTASSPWAIPSSQANLPYPSPNENLPLWGEEREWRYSIARAVIPNGSSNQYVYSVEPEKNFDRTHPNAQGVRKSSEPLAPLDDFPPLQSAPRTNKVTRPLMVNKRGSRFIAISNETNAIAKLLQINDSDDNSIMVGKIADPKDEELLARSKRNMPSQQGGENIRAVSSSHSPSESAIGTNNYPPLENSQNLQEYNFHIIKDSLIEGLEQVRTHRGDIRLSAKAGKILWANMKSAVHKNVWEVTDIKDVVVGGHGVKPVFNDITTSIEILANSIADILPEPYERVAYFEISAAARNQRRSDYKMVTMFVNANFVDLQKVTTPTKKVVEVDWVSLDHKLDFQLSLSTHILIKHDVKPFNTFIKKVAVSPKTKEISFQNIPDFLEVKRILFKQKTKFRLHYPFVVEVSRVVDVPLQKPKGGHHGDKMIGNTHNGEEIWYEFEFLHNDITGIFKQNSNLPLGKIASWTVEEVLGEGQEQLVCFVRTMMMFIEKCESVFQDSKSLD